MTSDIIVFELTISLFYIPFIPMKNIMYGAQKRVIAMLVIAAKIHRPYHIAVDEYCGHWMV